MNHTMHIENLTKALADQTRLRLLLLLTDHREICVCEFTQALELSQPKISRHLAILRETGLLKDKKRGLWVYYHLHPELPQWVIAVLNSLQMGSQQETLYQKDKTRLQNAEQQNSQCVRD